MQLEQRALRYSAMLVKGAGAVYNLEVSLLDRKGGSRRKGNWLFMKCVMKELSIQTTVKPLAARHERLMMHFLMCFHPPFALNLLLFPLSSDYSANVCFQLTDFQHLNHFHSLCNGSKVSGAKCVWLAAD